MVKAKKKKPENLRVFLSQTGNQVLASITLVITVFLAEESIVGLRSNTYMLNCGGELRPYPYAMSLDEAHAGYRFTLWVAGAMLVLLMAFLMYRNKLVKRILIAGLIIFGVGSFFYMIGQAFQGIGCLNW
jgi:hypothetical protein